ncbi:uncharacterized protein BBA_09962 [Beauveria bassiana ARSEF 2860]|uniref:Uncharacterized protein n=1 Tax=Beauveria bassiana (strain ARSEF 2860) TaxID=655819 RepID=J4VR02_BEAB2|nr:uncharacterized protein BBA_09962 [Beauveria bassiana ARSEF 2860]EJP61095.1 hypothetical protein BBA_09962 [Beauveria bassiana ARSEF 2860]
MDFPAPSPLVHGYTTLTYIEFIASGKYTRNYRSKCAKTGKGQAITVIVSNYPGQIRDLDRPLDQEGRGTKESPNDTETGSELENAVPESEL